MTTVFVGRIPSISIVAACMCLNLALAAPPAKGMEKDGEKTAPPAVEVLGTQLLSIHSAIAGQDYNLDINLPRNYKDTSRSFPVIYLLDAQWDFPLVSAQYGNQYYDGFLPDAITVGITWGGNNPNYDSLRTRDFTPTPIAQAPFAGNAPKFLAFIKQELIPFIASRYRTDPSDRTLMGSSLGGLFTLYAMFHETGLFTRYILTSPAISWDNGVLYSYEKDYHAKNTRLPVRLFMAVGGLEGNIAEFQKFADLLKSRDYQGLHMETRVLVGTGHAGTKPEGFSRGLQSVFARETKQVDPAILKTYEGVYLLDPAHKASVAVENGHLVLIPPEGSNIELEADSDNHFFMRGAWLYISFLKNDAGKVTGAHVEQFQGAFDVKKEN